MGDVVSFSNDQPVARIRIGKKLSLCIRGFADPEFPLVEMEGDVLTGTLRLTCDQAERIGRSLLEAAAKARVAPETPAPEDSAHD